MNIVEAIEQVEAGVRVRRESWPETSWVSQVVGGWSGDLACGERVSEEATQKTPFLVLFASGVVAPWTPSIGDVTAADWSTCGGE